MLSLIVPNQLHCDPEFRIKLKNAVAHIITAVIFEVDSRIINIYGSIIDNIKKVIDEEHRNS